MVTLLMAVYNAEQYLTESIGSVLRQTTQDWQLVCVDDASTDHSWQLLQAYEQQDARITAVHLDKNQGQAHARNVALRYAKGEYVMMLDADDWISEDALATLEQAFDCYPSTDCILLDLRYAYPDGSEKGYAWRVPEGKYHILPDGSFEEMTGHEAFVLSITWQIHGVYAARKRLYDACPYDETCRHYSDDNTTRLHYRMARTVRCSTARYYYRQQEKSVTHQIGVGRMNWMKSVLSLRQQLLHLGESAPVLSLCEHHLLLVIVDCYGFYYRHRKAFSKDEQRYCLETLYETWRTLNMERLKGKHIVKLGYFPFHLKWMPTSWQWTGFRIEEEIYFMLKTVQEKMRH